MCILAGTGQADEAGQRLHPLDPRLRTIRPSELSLAALLIHWAQARALHHPSGIGGTSDSPADGLPYSIRSTMSTTRCWPLP